MNNPITRGIPRFARGGKRILVHPVLVAKMTVAIELRLYEFWQLWACIKELTDIVYSSFWEATMVFSTTDSEQDRFASSYAARNCINIAYVIIFQSCACVYICCVVSYLCCLGGYLSSRSRSSGKCARRTRVGWRRFRNDQRRQCCRQLCESVVSKTAEQVR